MFLERLKFFFKDVLLYGSASVLNKGFALITFPLLARSLPVAEYGRLDLLLVMVTLLSILMVFGFDSAVARFYYDQESLNERKQLFSQALLFQLFVVILFLPVLFCQDEILLLLIDDFPDRLSLGKLALLQIPFVLISNFALNTLKWTLARKEFLFLTIGSTIFSLLVLVFAIYHFEAALKGILTAYLIGRMGAATFGLYLCRKWLVKPTSLKFIKTMLPYSVPIGLISVLGAFLPALERSMVAKILGETDLGVFAAGVKVGLLVSLPVQAFQMAWGPFALSLYKSDDSLKVFNLILKGFSIFVFVVALALGYFAVDLIKLLASTRYLGAVIVVFPIALGASVQGLGWIFDLGITISKKTYFKIVQYFIHLCVNFGAIYYCAPIYGIAGVAWAMLLGHLASTAMVVYLARVSFPILWDYSRVFNLFLVTIAFGLASYFLEPNLDLWLLKLTQMILLAIFLGLALFILFNSEDRRYALLQLKRFNHSKRFF